MEDLATDGGKSGQWYDSDGSYTIPKVSNFKKYKVSKIGHSDDFGTKDVLTVANSSGNERFYVMALDDVDTKTHCWYYSAYDYGMSDWQSQTSTSFGSGKQNTKNMIAKWNSSGYGSPNGDSSYPDMWGLRAVQSGTWNGSSGWYVPSKQEWSAFGDKLGITSNNYGNKGLNDYCWSSSQNSDILVWTPYFKHCMMRYFVPLNFTTYVRLGVTF